MKRYMLLLCFTFQIFANTLVELPHVSFVIKDPLIEKIISSDGFNRLKNVHQYGVSALNQINEKYSRYDHCLGVMALLKKERVPYLEQISGLLHDASHTAFSHFGDYYFKSHGEDAWQDIHHNQLLDLLGLKSLIEAHRISLDSIYHKNKNFSALDQPLPHLCADRLDYNLQGSLRHNLLTQEEAKTIYHDAKFQNGYWSLSDIYLARKLALSSIKMMETIWSCPLGHVSNLVLCKIMKRACDLELITIHDLCTKDDLYALEILKSSEDPFIKKGLKLIYELPNLIHEGKTFVIPYKCRALDPTIRLSKGYKNLSDIDMIYKRAFKNAVEKAKKGMSFDIHEEALSEYQEYFDELIATESSSRL